MSEKGIFFMLSLSEILILSNSEIYDWLQTAPFGFRMAWYGTHRFPRLLGFLPEVSLVLVYILCILYIH